MIDLIFITTEIANETAKKTFEFNPIILLYALALIILTVIFIKILQNVIVNSIIGVVALLFLYYVLNIKLPFVITLIITVIFGPAGLGVMLVLKFFGIV
ncbi:hypothetical protein EOM09_04935 [bacterium]|nr:hypothetical protein [bacterium]